MLYARIRSRSSGPQWAEGKIWLFILPFRLEEAPMPFLVHIPSVSSPSSFQGGLPQYRREQPLSPSSEADAEADASPGDARLGPRQSTSSGELSMHGGQRVGPLQQQQQPPISPMALRSPPGPISTHRISTSGAMTSTPATMGGVFMRQGRRSLDMMSLQNASRGPPVRAFTMRGDALDMLDINGMQGGGGERGLPQPLLAYSGGSRPPRFSSRQVSESAEEPWMPSKGDVAWDNSALYMAPMKGPTDAGQWRAVMPHGGASFGHMAAPEQQQQRMAASYAPYQQQQQLKRAPSQEMSQGGWDIPGAPRHLAQQGRGMYSSPFQHPQQQACQHQPYQPHPHPHQQLQQQLSGLEIDPNRGPLYASVGRVSLGGSGGAHSWSGSPQGSPSGHDFLDPSRHPFHGAMRGSNLQHAGSAPGDLPALELGLWPEPPAPRARWGNGVHASASVPTSDRSTPEASPQEANRPASIFRVPSDSSQLEQRFARQPSGGGLGGQEPQRRGEPAAQAQRPAEDANPQLHAAPGGAADREPGSASSGLSSC